MYDQISSYEEFQDDFDFYLELEEYEDKLEEDEDFDMLND